MQTTTDSRLQEERDTYNAARRLGLTYVDTRSGAPDQAAESVLAPQEATRLRALPLRVSGRTIEIGVPLDFSAEQFEAMRQTFRDYQVHFSVISESGLREGLARLGETRRAGSSADDAPESLLSDFRSLETALAAANPKDLFTILVTAAARVDASDLHVEPGERGVRIRFRIDGVLHPVAQMSFDHYKNLLADLQIRAGMKWGLGEAQGGRLRFPVEGGRRILDLRIETVPALHGEDVVIRLFHLEARLLDLSQLGMNKGIVSVVEEVLRKPHGMVLTVGPTGSGKTSTLYALLARLNSPERKIVTLEDPVEYELPGTTQIPVNSAEHSFAEMLRDVLREDPDTVMIGEIRDADTAKTALQAALTGHLILSSFHAIDTAAAVTRLLDLTGEQVLVTASLRLIIAQRLVRRVCPDCSSSYEPSPEIRESIEHILSSLPENMVRPPIKLYRGKGCAACHSFGYRGRVGLFEALSLSPALKELIVQGAATDKLRAQARSEGLVTLEQDGILKALEGQTTIEEVYRVVGTD